MWVMKRSTKDNVTLTWLSPVKVSKRGKVKVILGQFITLCFIFMGIEHVLKVKRGAGVWDEMQQGRPNGVI